MKLSSYPVSQGHSYNPVLQYIIYLFYSHGLIYIFLPSCSADHQVHFYTVPSLDPFPIKPIRHVVTFAVDDQHLKRPPPSAQGVRLPVEPVDFCIVKRSSLAMYSLKDRLSYLKVSCLLPL